MIKAANSGVIVSMACMTVFLAQLGMMIYLPGVPAIAYSFHASSSVISLSLPIYLVGMAAPMLIWGHWGGRWGTKKVLMVSLLLFSLCSALLAQSNTIGTFLFLRFFQGFAASGMSVMARSLIAQRFKGAQLAKALSWLSIAFVISLGVGQYIGAVLINAAGWTATFWLLALGALFHTGLFFWFIPDSQQPERSSTGWKLYLTIVRHGPFLTPALMGGLGYGLLIAFNTAAPAIFQTVYQWSVTDYGNFGWAMSVAYMSGSLSVNRWVMSLGQSRFNTLGIRIMMAGSAAMTCAVIVAPTYALMMWLPYCFIVFGQAINYPVSLSQASENTPIEGPYTMAMCGFIHQLLAAFIGMTVSLIDAREPLHLAFIFLLLACVIGKLNSVNQRFFKAS